MSQSDVPSFDDLLDSATESALHLEMRDQYAVSHENEHFRIWKETGERPTDPDSPYWRAWVSLVRRTVARGVPVRRVRIVSEPVTEYIRYEYAGTPVNLAAGEQVRWLARRRASDIALPGNDFWLIDGRLIRWNHFTGDGQSAGGEMCDDPATAKLCATAFEAAWERATPHSDYKV
ncbi:MULTISPECIES: DUF6879 family protein [Streptomyces]|uniref:DUF6879 family protein n=1 Tax=Streptomyces TaxID=1883 RepID=UPI0004CD5DDB|nr:MULTISPECIES: DUF6879 family protein [Streptomyces]GHJ23800.1 hypothetical protein TPA0909_54140 [Streptomyces albus]